MRCKGNPEYDVLTGLRVSLGSLVLRLGIRLLGGHRCRWDKNMFAIPLEFFTKSACQ